MQNKFGYAYVKPVVYCFWTGDNPMSPNRVKALNTMRENIGVEIDFIDVAELNRRVGIENLHPAYKYLSCNHKSDYLRCYFMNHFGGGYSDIKHFTKNNNWKEQFDLINSDLKIEVIGSKEIPSGSPILEYNNEPNLSKLLSNGWFICRKNTDFTREWYKRVCKILDNRMDDLIKYPATEPFGGKSYKLRWAELQGEPFHQLLIEKYNSEKIRNSLISGGSLFIPYR